jgi:hypothetical protein
MKRFLILFILFVFVTVSCAGRKKWTKPDFDQDKFEKDREECLQAVKNDAQADLTLEECLVKKGYEPESEPPSEKEKSKTAETSKTVGKVLLVTGLDVVGVAAAAAYLALLALAGAGGH